MAMGGVLLGGDVREGLNGSAAASSRLFLSARCKELLRCRIVGTAKVDAAVGLASSARDFVESAC